MTEPAELNLLGQNELAVIDRWALERRARALAQPLYLGDRLALCRVLGRYKLYVDTRDVGFGAHVLLDGCWEAWLTVFMARRLRPGMAAVDVGANHGYYTLLFADLVGPAGMVAAVEPNPHLCRLLRRSVEVNGFGDRLTILEQAASAGQAGDAFLHIPEDEPKNARVVGPEMAGPGSIPISAASLDHSLAGWPRVDFVKIDVEGAEEATIDGMAAILERDRPDLVLEFNAGRCADPAGLLERLAALYGALRFIDVDCLAHPVDAGQLLDTSRTDDWLLFLSVRE